jgi:hypothetical protein
MTYTRDTIREPGLAVYPLTTLDGRQLRVVSGSVQDALTIRDTILKATPGAFIRYERINYDQDEAHVEIEMPEAGP